MSGGGGGDEVQCIMGNGQMRTPPRGQTDNCLQAFASFSSLVHSYKYILFIPSGKDIKEGLD